MLTDKEREVIEVSCKLHNLFCNLPVFHVSDIREEVIHIHAIQNMIMAREAYRSNPKMFPIKNGHPNNMPIGILATTSMNFVSFDNIPMTSEKCIHPQKYRMKKLRIKKVDATYFSLSKYMRLEGQFQARNFQTAYFLQVRIIGLWFTIQTYISIDSNYALLCATEAMEKLQEKL
ncbi:hypothetical protein [Phocaeicola plebeius]|jgi:hypothetical protein|uniref:hypothetical protein n=1 Tax=Phocaeicola plebeius TaxID=310297 RepID=UPI003F7CE603